MNDRESSKRATSKVITLGVQGEGMTVDHAYPLLFQPELIGLAPLTVPMAVDAVRFRVNWPGVLS